MRLVADAARRFALLLSALGGGTALLAVGVGALAGRPLGRSVSVGFYLVGALLIVLGFVLGTRPPLRPRNGSHVTGPWYSGGIRLATRRELDDALGSSAVLVVAGLALVLIGVGVDGRRPLF